MADPLVVQRMREWKAGLLARERQQMEAMAQQWLQVEQSLQAKVDALVAAAREAAEQGKEVSASTVWQIDHYRGLVSQAQAEAAKYARYAADLIAQGQAELGPLGIEHADAAIQLSYLQNGTVGATFDRLPIESTNVIIGLAGNGQPVGDLLRLRMVKDADGNPLPGVLDALTRALIDGVAQGINPRLIARQMQDALAGGLYKAMVIARSEQLRAYRFAASQAYQESGVVTVQKRLATKDVRTCMACIAADGMIYPIDEPIPDHPQGRCTGVPVVKGLPETTWPLAGDWFAGLSDADQQAMMGLGRWDAWKDGAFELGDLIKVTQSAVWGEGLVPTPLQDLI